MGQKETYSLWQEAYDKAMGRVHFPIVEYKPPKKRIYRNFMYCEHCHLGYNKSGVYKAKYCVQCGQPMVKKRKLIAVWKCYDNFMNGRYELKSPDMDDQPITKE